MPLGLNRHPTRLADAPKKLVRDRMRLVGARRRLIQVPIGLNRRPTKLADAPEKLVRDRMSLTRDPMSLIRDRMSVIRDGVRLIRDRMRLMGCRMTLIGDPMTLVGDPMTLMGDPMTLMGDPMSLTREPVCLLGAPEKLDRALLCPTRWPTGFLRNPPSLTVATMASLRAAASPAHSAMPPAARSMSHVMAPRQPRMTRAGVLCTSPCASQTRSRAGRFFSPTASTKT